MYLPINIENKFRNNNFVNSLLSSSDITHYMDKYGGKIKGFDYQIENSFTSNSNLSLGGHINNQNELSGGHDYGTQ